MRRTKTVQISLLMFPDGYDSLHVRHKKAINDAKTEIPFVVTADI
jgi:hypothetical protein